MDSTDLPWPKLTHRITFLNTASHDHICIGIIYRLGIINQVRNVGISVIRAISFIWYGRDQPVDKRDPDNQGALYYLFLPHETVCGHLEILLSHPPPLPCVMKSCLLFWCISLDKTSCYAYITSDGTSHHSQLLFCFYSARLLIHLELQCLFLMRRML